MGDPSLLIRQQSGAAPPCMIVHRILGRDRPKTKPAFVVCAGSVRRAKVPVASNPTAETQSTKSECRNPKQIKMSEIRRLQTRCARFAFTARMFGVWSFRTFGFRVSNLFRISCFGFRISALKLSQNRARSFRWQIWGLQVPATPDKFIQ